MYNSFLVYYVLYVPGVLISFLIFIQHFQLKTLDRSLNFVSWNVKGLNHPVKRRRVFSHIKQFKATFVFLQETHIRGSDSTRLMSQWAGQHFHSSFQAKARGVSILVDPNIPFVHHNVMSDSSGHFVIVSGKLYNTMMVLANVYAPNVDNVGFFERFFSSLPDLNSRSLVLSGDFNCWLDPVLDRSSPNPDSISRSASFIQSFLSNFGVSDVWRSLHPNKRKYSSHAPHTFTRIDYFFIDNELLPLVRSCAYQGIVISDHAPVVLSLALPDLPQIKKHWRINSTLLSDNDFVNFMKEHLSFFFETNTSPDTSSLVVWDALKAYLRGQIISYTANMRKRAHHERLELADQIKEIDKQYAQAKNPDLYKMRVELQTKFDLASTYLIERQLLRSKSLFYIHSEKSGKLLANQLRGLKAKGHITNIKMEDGMVTSDHAKINNTFSSYYSQLYTSEFSNTILMDTFLNQLNIPTLSPDSKMRLDEP